MRMSMIIGVGPGADAKFDIQKVKAYKLFANKLWNITRFILSSTEKFDGKKPTNLTGPDLANIEELERLVVDLTKDMDNYRFYLAGEKLYHYVWHTFADKIIEESKSRVRSENMEVINSTEYTLRHILLTSLKLLHPFMPFITEEIWMSIKNEKENLLMVTSWPGTK